MNKEFIPYEQALELKELGFDEPCFAVYIDKTLIMEDDWLYSTNQDTFIESSNFTAPLYQQAFRWFREKYGLHHVVEYDPIDKVYSSLVRYDYLEDLPTYEEAELACLKNLIEIVKTIKPC
jgi:hypothetical protein